MLYLKKAGDLVTATIDTLSEYRSDSQWQKFLSYSKDVAKLHDIPAVFVTFTRRYDGDIIWETTGSSQSGQDLKVALYYAIIDSFVSEQVPKTSV